MSEDSDKMAEMLDKQRKRRKGKPEKGKQAKSKKSRYDFVGFANSDSSDKSDGSSSDDSENEKSSNASPKPTKETPNAPIGGYGKAEKMMKMHGYKSGEGLGKNKQGRVEPVSLSTQQGRRGVGFIPTSQGKPYEGPSWNPDSEIIRIEEKPIWLEGLRGDPLCRDVLDDGMVIGTQKMTIDDEVSFCDPNVLKDILSLKTLFDQIPKEKLRTLVGRCNMYETIENVFFINRAALKMANLDAVFDFMFTNPLNEQGKPLSACQLLYFADVCAGPGGFSEYVLWRKKWKAKGFGFTLRGNNDFKLSSMHAAPTESFFPYYGKNNDGDIFNPDNIQSLKDFVMENCEDNNGVNFLMADGGFSVEGEENIQEIKSKQLYLCQCIAALALLKDGGDFVVKLFDTFTEFSVGLIYLMYRCFKKICIHKPVTSRPANSERYLICKSKHATAETIEQYLVHVNETMWAFSKDSNRRDVIQLVPLDLMKDDEAFYEYMCQANNRIGKEQIISLLKINECHKEATLLDSLIYDNSLTHEEKQASVRKECLKYWRIPDEKRKTAQKPTHKEMLKKLADKMHMETSYMSEEVLKSTLYHIPKQMQTESDLHCGEKKKNVIQSVYDWYYVCCDTLKDTSFNFYLGLGGPNVYKLEGKTWRSFDKLFLPEGTLVLAENVEEKRGESRGIHKSHSIHIIDAFSLGYDLIHNYCLKWRNEFIRMFCASINRCNNNTSSDMPSYYPVRFKNLYKFSMFLNNIAELKQRRLKNNSIANTSLVPSFKKNSDIYFVVNGFMFFKFTKDPWMISNSKSRNCEYYFNQILNKSTFSLSVDAFAHTTDAIKTSFTVPYIREGLRTESFKTLMKCLKDDIELF